MAPNYASLDSPMYTTFNLICDNKVIFRLIRSKLSTLILILISGKRGKTTQKSEWGCEKITCVWERAETELEGKVCCADDCCEFRREEQGVNIVGLANVEAVEEEEEEEEEMGLLRWEIWRKASLSRESSCSALNSHSSNSMASPLSLPFLGVCNCRQ